MVAFIVHGSVEVIMKIKIQVISNINKVNKKYTTLKRSLAKPFSANKKINPQKNIVIAHNVF